METINAIYDGQSFKAIDPIPVIGEYRVKIVFEEPITLNDSYDSVLLKHHELQDEGMHLLSRISLDNEIEYDTEEILEALMDCYGLVDEDYFNMMQDIIKERENFSLGRPEVDFS